MNYTHPDISHEDLVEMVASLSAEVSLLKKKADIISGNPFDRLIDRIAVPSDVNTILVHILDRPEFSTTEMRIQYNPTKKTYPVRHFPYVSSQTGKVETRTQPSYIYYDKDCIQEDTAFFFGQPVNHRVVMNILQSNGWESILSSSVMPGHGKLPHTKAILTRI